MFNFASAWTVAGAVLVMTAAAPASATTVLFAGNAVEIGQTLDDPTDLWVTAEDLTRINGFEVKPEGACLGDICIPLTTGNPDSMLLERDGERWISVTGLAGKLQQAHAVDHDTDTWSFAQIPQTRATFLQSAQAPDFALQDRHGDTVRLSDYRGKKVLLLTWASW